MISEIPVASKRVRRLALEPKTREVVVCGVEPVGAGFVRVSFSGPSLAGFNSPGFDDHVKFFFETPAGERVGRHYTVRAFDLRKGTLSIEFGLHGTGVAAAWARQVRPGQRAVIAGPRGSTVMPDDCGWHLLTGDATALPAIRRRLEELPTGSRALVRVLATEADRLLPTSAAEVDVQWAGDEEELAAAVAALAWPAGEGIVWGAGEAGLMERLRSLLLRQDPQPPAVVRLGAYWKRGNSDFHVSLTSPMPPPATVPAGHESPGSKL